LQRDQLENRSCAGSKLGDEATAPADHFGGHARSIRDGQVNYPGIEVVKPDDSADLPLSIKVDGEKVSSPLRVLSGNELNGYCVFTPGFPFGNGFFQKGEELFCIRSRPDSFWKNDDASLPNILRRG